MSTEGVLRLLIDTNVWMDYFSGRSDRTANVVRLVEIADASERIVLFASSLSVKDVSYLVSAAIKQECRRKTGSLSNDAIAAADETAWACVRQMRELALIAPVGADEVFDSFVFKYHHNDFEDDLMLGVANRIDVDYVVTEDKNLIKHTNGICINAEQALRLVGEASIPSTQPV
mgnify:CR=1 FL=1